MSQTILDPSTSPVLSTLDTMFTQLYDLREKITTPSYTASTPKLTFDANYNLGFRVTPSGWGTVAAIEGSSGALGFNGTAASYWIQNLYFNGSSWIYKNTAAASVLTQSGGAYFFNIAPSGTAGGVATLNTAMVLDNNGNLLTGVTTYANQNANGFMLGASGSAYALHLSGTSSGSGYWVFSYNGGVIGTIVQNGTTGVAYNTSSDYRLKDNIDPITGSGAFIDALRPVTWTWKVDGSAGSGFIAHELQAVSPSSVTGTKDAVDSEGKPIYQAVEYGSAEVIAMLVAEVQALRVRVATLEAK